MMIKLGTWIWTYRMKLHACVACSALLLVPASAFAYVDPGTGMLVWQGLIAAVGAVLVFVRSPRESIKRRD